MIAVLYRFKVKEYREAEFIQAWHQVASYFKAQRGALGSCLHRGEEGLWYAYSQWPDEDTRKKSWPPEDNATLEQFNKEIQQSIDLMQACCTEDKFPEIRLQIVDNLLEKYPYENPGY